MSTTAPAVAPEDTSTSPRTVLIASLIGTTIEWYDFFLFATAAGIVFPQLFYGDGDPTVATLLSFATFAIGFVARPIGGLIFGHIGDRVGRRETLIVTMALTGLATAAIGFLPTVRRDRRRRPDPARRAAGDPGHRASAASGAARCSWPSSTPRTASAGSTARPRRSGWASGSRWAPGCSPCSGS